MNLPPHNILDHVTKVVPEPTSDTTFKLTAYSDDGEHQWKIEFNDLSFEQAILEQSREWDRGLQQEVKSIKLNLRPVGTVYMTIHDITPPKRLTIEEIEKKLGYKVEIISKENTAE